MDENDEFISRIRKHVDTLIADSNGIILHTTLDQSKSLSYAAEMKLLSSIARNAVRDLDPTNDLMYLRVLSRKQEVMVSSQDEYMLVSVQFHKRDPTKNN